MVYPADDAHYIGSWNSGQSQLINLLEKAIRELKLLSENTDSIKVGSKITKGNKKWYLNPWLIGVGGTVIAGLILYVLGIS